MNNSLPLFTAHLCRVCGGRVHEFKLQISRPGAVAYGGTGCGTPWNPTPPEIEMLLTRALDAALVAEAPAPRYGERTDKHGEVTLQPEPNGPAPRAPSYADELDKERALRFEAQKQVKFLQEAVAERSEGIVKQIDMQNIEALSQARRRIDDLEQQLARHPPSSESDAQRAKIADLEARLARIGRIVTGETRP